MPKYYSHDEFYVCPEGYTAAQEKKAREYFSANFERILERNDAYQQWRKRALNFLLTNLGPRIAALNPSREMVESYACLIHRLNLVFQFTANNAFMHERQENLIIAIPMNLEFLVKDVLKEESDQAWEKANPDKDYWEYRAEQKRIAERKSALRRRRVNRAYNKEMRRLGRPEEQMDLD